MIAGFCALCDGEEQATAFLTNLKINVCAFHEALYDRGTLTARCAECDKEIMLDYLCEACREV